VDASGSSRYVTEGQLRASHRATATPPWNNLGLPWHPSRRADLRPLVPGEPAELRFVLQPTATRFNRGHRLRISVTGADADNTEAPPITGRATVTILRDAQHPSGVTLPLLKPR
jgi:predicted acyl esterase